MKKRLQVTIDEPREPLRASCRGGRGKPREVSVASLYRPAESAGATGERASCLRLSGRWLQELGFVKGRRVVVASEEGRLTLTVADCMDPPIGALRLLWRTACAAASSRQKNTTSSDRRLLTTLKPAILALRRGEPPAIAFVISKSIAPARTPRQPLATNGGLWRSKHRVARRTADPGPAGKRPHSGHRT